MNRAALNVALFLDCLAKVLPVWCYAAGGVWLILKILHLLPAWYPLVCAISFLIPLLYALIVCLRRRYTPEDLLAWLDWRNQAGGALLAAGTAALTQNKTLRVRPGCSLLHLLRRGWLPVLFLAGAGLVPPPSEDGPGGSGRGVQRQLQALEERVAAFAERGALPAPVAAQLKDQIEQLEQAAALNPEAAAEGVAALQQKLENSMLMRLSAGLESARKAEEAARAAAQKGSGAAEDQTRQMFAALENLQAAEGGELPPEVRNALNDALKKLGAGSLAACRNLPAGALAGLKPEDLKKLCEALKQSNCRNASACKSCAGALEGAAAAAALKQLLEGTPGLSAQDLRLSEALAECTTNSPGSGGIDRGRGDARLSFGDEADRDSARFTPKVLPTSGQFLPGVTVAREREAATDQKVPDEFRPAQRTGAAVPQSLSAGESAAVLSPARAAAAERYFTGLAGSNPAGGKAAGETK